MLKKMIIMNLIWTLILIFILATMNIFYSDKEEKFLIYKGFVEKEYIVDIDYEGHLSGVNQLKITVRDGDRVKRVICTRTTCDLSADYSNGFHIYQKEDSIITELGLYFITTKKINEIDGIKVKE